MATDTVVLAFSGGLDTSYCLLDLKQRGYTVHSVFVDTGGVSKEEAQAIADRAMELGSDQHHTLDASHELWNEFVRPLVWAHARMNDEYPLLCSDRYLIVRKSLELADQLGTTLFAHGCTGMGNDQLRFDQTVRSLGDYQIIAPIRELQAQVTKQGIQIRDFEMQVLRDAGHQVSSASQAYSINENLLGVTVSGSEIDQFQRPADSSWQLCKPRAQWPDEALELTIDFSEGVAVGLNGEALEGPTMLAELNRSCGAYGIGRHIYTGDVSIGLKGHIVFECPGIDALLCAHQALEDAVNTRWQNQFRHMISKRWAELVYTGFFYEPHKFDLEAYLASSQQHVTGSVTLASEGGTLLPVTVDSNHILQDSTSVYAQSASWTAAEAVGFIKLTGQSSTLSARINGVAGPLRK